MRLETPGPDPEFDKGIAVAGALVVILLLAAVMLDPDTSKFIIDLLKKI